MELKYIGISLVVVTIGAFYAGRYTGQGTYNKAVIEGCQKVVNAVADPAYKPTCMSNGNKFFIRITSPATGEVDEIRL